MSNNTTTQSPTITPETTETVKADFGNGKYSREMERIYGELQTCFKIDKAKALKIAKQVGADFGELMKNQTTSINVGKVSSSKTRDSVVTIGESVSKLKGVTLTNTLMIVRALQWIADAQKNGVSFGFTQWELIPPLKTWVAEMVVK